MKRPDDERLVEELRDELKEAHEPTRRSAPEFEDVWRSAEEASGDAPGKPARSGMSPVWAAAAALLVAGIAASFIFFDPGTASHDAESKLAEAERSVDRSDTRTREEDDAETLAEYDILDWEPSTDVLLAQDDRLLEPPELGNPGWGEDDWMELTDEELERL